MRRPEAFAIAGGIAFLTLYFRAVSIRWPESYFRLGSTLENTIASSPFRYVAFRFLPVFATCLFLAVTMERSRGRPTVVVAAVTVLHLIVGLGWATFEVLAGRRYRSRRVPILLAYGAVAIGVVAAAVLALVLRDPLAPVVPEPGELSAALWTAAFAGLAGAYVTQLGVRRGERVARSVRRSKSLIDERLWRVALDAAREHGVSPEVVFAFMVVENLQRPAWFRSLENRLGRLWGTGSYAFCKFRRTIQSVMRSRFGALSRSGLHQLSRFKNGMLSMKPIAPRIQR